MSAGKVTFTSMQTKSASVQESPDGPRVLKLSVPETSSAKSFEMSAINRMAKPVSPSTAKPAAASVARTQKDKRFALSSLVQDPVALEAEAKREFEAQLQARLEAELARLKQEAFAQGFAEGTQQGHAEAKAEGAAAAQAELAKLQALVAAFEGAKTEIYQANERYLLELVFRIGRMLFLKDLSTDKEYLARLARELVERLGARENIRVRLSPRDADQIAAIKAELAKGPGGELRNLSIETDSELAGGGLEVQTEWSALDASIDTQLKAIHEALCSS